MKNFPAKLIMDDGEEIDLKEKQHLVIILNETETVKIKDELLSDEIGEVFCFDIYGDCRDEVLEKLAETLPTKLREKIVENMEKKINASLEFGKEMLKESLQTGTPAFELLSDEKNILRFAQKLGITKEEEIERFKNIAKEWQEERRKKDEKIN